MSILPTLDLNIDDLINQSIEDSSGKITIPREYAWDFQNNTFLLVDGKFKIVTGKEALQVWIWKALHTMRLKYSIYSDDYGHDLDSLIGNGFSSGLIESEAKRLVWECLSPNAHILDIIDFIATSDGDTLNVSFTAITDQGEVNINV